MYEFVSPMEPVVMRAPKAFKWPEQTTVIPPIMIHGTLTEKHLDIWQLFILVTVNYTDKKKTTNWQVLIYKTDLSGSGREKKKHKPWRAIFTINISQNSSESAPRKLTNFWES